MNKPNSSRNILVFIIVLLGVMSRFLPHPPNVTGFAAVTLFAGAMLNSRIFAAVLPLGLYYLSDFFINNTVSRSFFPDHEGLVFWSSYMTFVYLGFAATAIIGYALLKNRNNTRIASATIIATLAFWVLSNFGILIQPGGYPNTITGAVACFTAALPFLLNSLIGNLIFTFGVFKLYDFISERYFQKQSSIA